MTPIEKVIIEIKDYIKKSWFGWLFWMTPIIIYYFTKN
jgi:hypothetical protein